MTQGWGGGSGGGGGEGQDRGQQVQEHYGFSNYCLSAIFTIS